MVSESARSVCEKARTTREAWRWLRRAPQALGPLGRIALE